MRKIVLSFLVAVFILASNPGLASAGIVIGPPPPPPAQYSSVAFIPGIEGSRLFDTPSVLFGTPDELWEPLLNSHVQDLFLDSNGKSINTNVYVGSIIDQAVLPILGPKIYQSFMNSMDSLTASHTIAHWKAL